MEVEGLLHRGGAEVRWNACGSAERTIKKRLADVVSYCTHGITNAVAEGVNSKIMAIKRRVGGYRNKQHFKTAIFFYCGGLNLYP